MGIDTEASFDGSHTYADNDTFTVTVTATDDDGGSETGTLQVTVTNELPVVAAVANQAVNEGDLPSAPRSSMSSPH